MEAKQQDLKKRQFWQRTIHEAVRSKLSIREFCRQHRLQEGQFYWWQRRLNGQRRTQGLRRHKTNGTTASYTWRGKSSTRFVRQERVAKMRDKIANYKRMQELIKEWVDLSMEQERQERAAQQKHGDRSQ
jgi:hypothetical protein